MNEKVHKWLFDIRIAIEEIDSFFKNKTKNYEVYKDDMLIKRAVERNLEIIGEAVNRIIKSNPDIPISSARNIIGLRNHIIHAYDNVSDEYIWGVIAKHLPKLKQEVELLIKEFD